MNFDIIIKNGTLHSSQKSWQEDIGIKDGKIVKLAKFNEDELSNATRVIDAQGLDILPGLIDSQVHFREPGLTHKEDIAHGSKAAVLGGICTFFEMPNTKPATTSVEATQVKVDIAKETSYANFGFFIGASGKNLDELIKSQDMVGCSGVKIFLGSSTGDLLLYDTDKLVEIFKTLDCHISVHSESEERLHANVAIRDNANGDVHAHYKWRDAQTALESTKMIIEVAKKAGRKVHILHLTTKDEIEFLKDQKEHCTIEVTPQHLTLFAPDIYDKIGTLAQMNPPIRTKDHTDGLWEGLKSGVIDVFGSDHAPHTLEEKDQPYPASPSGMPGVQTMLPVMLTHVEAGKLTLADIVTYLAENPASLFKLNKGFIKEGMDGDLTILDMNKKFTIKNEDQASKVGWTPFNTMEVQGTPTYTIVSGQVAMEHGKAIKVQAQPITRGK